MGGKSTSSVANTNQTWSLVDSYNRTYTQTLNMSDVGNVKINLPDATGAASGMDKTTLYVLAGVAAVSAAFLFRR